MDGSSFPSLIMQYAWMIPYLLVFLFGFVYAMINMSRCSGAAMLTMVAIGIMLLSLVGGTVVQHLALRMSDGGNIFTLMQILSVLRALAMAGGTAMLIFAVFLQRGAPLPPYNPMQGKPPA